MIKLLQLVPNGIETSTYSGNSIFSKVTTTMVHYKYFIYSICKKTVHKTNRLSKMLIMLLSRIALKNVNFTINSLIKRNLFVFSPILSKAF